MLSNFRFTRQLTNCLFRSGANVVRSYSSKDGRQQKGVLKVILMDENDKIILSCTIDEAKRYADKHDLMLVNYEGPTQTTKHKQMQVLTKSKVSDAQLDKSEKASAKNLAKKKKEVRKFVLSDSISDHDLDTKIKKIAFFLSKGNSVRLVINGFKMEQKAIVLDKIKSKFTPHLSLRQVANSSSQIKLIVIPEKTFAQHYEEVYKKSEHDLDTESGDDEKELLDDDLEDMINEKLK